MRRALALLSALVPVSLGLAGCVQSPAEGAQDPAAALPSSDLVEALRALPAPALDGPALVDWIGSFTTTHAPRITGTPQEKAAAEELAGQLAGFGYEVEILQYNLQGLPAPDGPLRVVSALKLGVAASDEIILLGAHYDTSLTIGNADVPGLPFGTGVTINAAYDNGSGTAMVVELARLLAESNTTHTVGFLLFNGEEEGLLASEAYANALAAEGTPVIGYLGFDMVGINYPSPAGCLCIYAGRLNAEEHNPLQAAVAFDLLGLPRADDTVQVFDNHDTRNSDEGAFASAGFPTLRWAGLASAGDYWGYHKMNDTIETMVAQAGDAQLLAQGLENVAATAYYTVLALDRVEAAPSH